jgi:hypothetical protein
LLIKLIFAPANQNKEEFLEALEGKIVYRFPQTFMNGCLNSTSRTEVEVRELHAGEHKKGEKYLAGRG